MNNKDWCVDIPSTDDEAREALKFGKSKLVGSAMAGIFNCRRAQGDNLLTAYETALRAYLFPDKITQA